MKKLAVLLSLISSVAAISVSCSKDYPQYKEAKEAFLYNDVKYNTLQDAVNAAVALQEDELVADHFIELLTNTSGPGVVVPESFYENIYLNLGRYSYEVTGGGSINIGNANLFIYGLGGYMFNPNKGESLIVSEDGTIIIEDDIALASEGEVIRTNSNVFVDENFTGSIDGDISLIQKGEEDEEYYNFDYLSKKGTMNIGKLTLSGKNATFDVRANLEKAGGIFIGELKADSQNALRAVDKSSVTLAKGGTVHVHNWEIKEQQEETCISNAEIIWYCADCDSYYVQEIEDGKGGRCPADSLVHHAAVAATDFNWGNIEYWECPLCGTLYADAKAQTELTGSPFLEPLYEEDDDQWQVDYCYDPQTKNPAAALSVVANIATVVSALSSTASTTHRFITEADKLKKLDDIYSGISALHQELGDVESRLGGKMQSLASQGVLYTRYGNLNALKISIDPYWKPIIDTLKNESISEEARAQAATNLVTKWRKEIPSFSVDLLKLVQAYYGGDDKVKVTTIPTHMEMFLNNKQMWEHQGYGWRTDFSLMDMCKVLACVQMDLIYQEFVAMKEDPASTNNRINQLIRSVENYYAEYQRDSTRMATRNAKYRVFVSGKYNIPYEIKAKNVDIRGWFTSHKSSKLDFKDYNGKYRETINQLIKDQGLDNIMDEDVAAIAGIKAGNRYQSIVKAGFTDIKGNNKDNLLVVGKDMGDWCDYGFVNKVVRSKYKFCYWENRTISRGNDLLRIDNVLSESANVTESLSIMNKARFTCTKRSNCGEIKDMGTYTEKRPLKIITKVKAEEKAEAIK